MSELRLVLPPLRPACRLTVTIPARDEAASLPACLSALVAQESGDSGAFETGAFDVVVLANGCSDGTAEIARSFAAAHPEVEISVFETTAERISTIGAARRALMDAAVGRFLDAGRPEGIVASLDADTVVDPDWIAWTLLEMWAADAVAGYVQISDAERDRMFAPQRLLYDREVAYRQLLGAVEHRLDPRPYDPAPRHDSLVGASFAVCADVYRAAGGMRPLAFHEDVAFAQSLERIDARVRHSYRVRATTSARERGRVDAGFGAFLADLGAKGEQRKPHLVRSALATVELARVRRLLRFWENGGDNAEVAGEIAGLTELAVTTIFKLVSAHATVGARFEALASVAKQRAYPDEPVEVVIGSFERLLRAGDAVAEVRDDGVA